MQSFIGMRAWKSQPQLVPPCKKGTYLSINNKNEKLVENFWKALNKAEKYVISLFKCDL